MFNPFNFLNLHPFMDADGGGSGSPALPDGGSPPEGETATGADGSANSGIETGKVDTDTPSQSGHNPEDNAKFAEMRVKARDAERIAAEAKAAHQRDIAIAKKYGAEFGVYSEADIAEQFGQSHGIKTLAEFESAIERQKAEEAAQKVGITPETLSQLLTPDTFNSLLEKHPLFQQMKQEKLQARVDESFRELSTEYPEFKSMDDLYKLPTFDKITSLVSKGYSLVDAYESTNKAEIRKQQTEIARQATLNSVSGRGHLKGNGQGSEIDTTTIPDDVLEMYKTFNPGKTLEEYKKHYKASLGK